MDKDSRSLTIAFFFFFYVGAQFIGGGKTLNALFDIDPKIGMIITAMIILPYTVAGGLKSVAYTDTIQAIVMIVTLIIAPPIVGIHYISTHHDVFAHSVTEALKASGPEYSTILGGTRRECGNHIRDSRVLLVLWIPRRNATAQHKIHGNKG
ncbi:hypothetical protein [Thermococcus sp. JCM 11816]|uniref:sodium:solute symporter family transporter n=1 Tax=Thermococcus sp. (strain JCM 11816 / KS-1) TaxID=1295125 RepID=UPI000AC30C7A